MNVFLVKYDLTNPELKNLTLTQIQSRNIAYNQINLTSGTVEPAARFCYEIHESPRDHRPANTNNNNNIATANSFRGNNTTVVIVPCPGSGGGTNNNSGSHSTGGNGPGGNGSTTGGNNGNGSTPNGNSGNGNNNNGGGGNSNSSSGGSSQTPLITEPYPNENPIDPCQNIKSKTISTQFMAKFNAINTQQNFNLSYETGFAEKKYMGATQYIDGTAVGGHSLRIPDNSIGSTHVHNNEFKIVDDGTSIDHGVKIQSPADLEKLITTCLNNAGSTPQDAYGIMISNDAIYSLSILEGNIDFGVYNANVENFKIKYKEKATEILTETTLSVTQRNDKLQKMLLLQLEILGLKEKVGLFQGEVITLPNGTKKINWTRKMLNANNNLIPNPC